MLSCLTRSLLLSLLLTLKLSAAQTIPIVVDSVLPDARSQNPVKFGVPFAKGALLDPSRIRITNEQGQTLPHQQRVTATWDPTGNQGVRWLLVDMRVDPGSKYFLVVEDQPQPPTSEPDIAQQETSAIRIDTGPLTGTIPTNQGLNLFDQLFCVGNPVVKNSTAAFSGFYIEHETRGIFRADLDPHAKIVLEENGPIRATIKADGWYVNSQGEKFGRYSIRAHFFKGRSEIRLDHTFIYTGLSKEDRLRSVSLALPREQGKRGFIGGAAIEDGQIVGDAMDNAYFLQDSIDREHIELTWTTAESGNAIRLADRAGGWMVYDQTRVAIRDAWQQYPWELEIEAGVIRVHLWPRHGRLLDTTWDGQWWFLNDHQKEAMVMTKPKGRGTPQERVERMRAATNATGVAKTHELWVSFAVPNWHAFPTMRHNNAASFSREVAYPVLAYADPQYTTTTRALDFSPHAPPDARWDELDQYLDAIHDMVLRITEERDMYGWWDWGGYHQHPYDDRLRLDAGRVDNHGMNTWHRARPKSHYSWGILPWNQVFRSGSRKWLRYAQTYTLYSADRAHVHHTAHGRDAGSEYHYDNSEIHWIGGYSSSPGGDMLASNLQYKGDYVAMYWLTGDRRPLDVLELWGQRIIEATDAGSPWGVWAEKFAVGNEIRNAGMQLHRLMTLYQATWNPKYLALANRVIQPFYGVQKREDLIEQEMYMGSRVHGHIGWAQEGLWLYWQITGDPKIRTPLQTFIDRSCDYDGGMGMGQGFGVLRAATNGYLLTGDLHYLNLGRGIVDYMLAYGSGPTSWSANTMKFDTVSMPLFIGCMAEADPAWRESKLPMHSKGNTLTYRSYDFSNSLARHGTRVFFRETTDRDWQVDALYIHSCEVHMIAPNGQVVARATIDATTNKQARFSIPADGQTGDYALVCVSAVPEPQRPTIPPLGRIVHADLPMVYEGTKADYTQPTGQVRKAYFQQPANKPMHLQMEWRVPLRHLDILTAQGQVIASTREQFKNGDNTTTIHIPASDQQRELSWQLSIPTREMAEQSFPFSLYLHGDAQYLAVNPSQWFKPVVRQDLPEPAAKP